MPWPWQGVKDGIVLAVRLTPKGSRDVIDSNVRMADGRQFLQAQAHAASSGGDKIRAKARCRKR